MSEHIIRLHVEGQAIDVPTNLTGDELIGWSTEPGVFNIWFREPIGVPGRPDTLPGIPEERKKRRRSRANK